MTTEFDQDEVARQVAEKLREKFPDTDAATLKQIVNEEVAVLAQLPVHDYVAVLSERAARKRLKKLD